jgi:Tfp pilus assembly protein PilN
MPIDLKKEIKLSDLFRRGGGPAPEDAGAEKAQKPEKEKKARKSFSFSRGPKEPRAPKEPKARKGTPKEAVAAKTVPPPPAVPLMRAFDLMPKEADRESTSVSPGFTKVAVALLAVLVVAGLGAGYMVMGARASDKQAKLDEVRARLAEVNAQAEPADAGNSASLTGEAQARTAALADALGSRVAWDRILREFSLVLPDDVVLVTLAAGAATTDAATAPVDPALAAGASLTITGTAPDQQTVAVLLSRLSVIPEFADVQLQSSARAGEEGTGGSGYQFSIVATISPGGEPPEETS